MDFELNKQKDQQTLRKELVPNYSVLMPSIKARIDDVLALLLVCNDKSMIQSFSRLGLFDETPLLRSHIWKLLLESLPVGPNWRQYRQQNYKVYQKLLEKQGFSFQQDLLGIQQNNQSNFNKVLWDEIMLDSLRTHSMMNFFQQQPKNIQVYSNKPTKHLDVLNRILYIWAILNGSVKYVQGMNELLAPIYFLEFQVVTPYSQSQTFYMFSSLITPLLDMHIKDMDKSLEGINGRMASLNKHLKMVDYMLWKKLEAQNVDPHFYSFRWLALMLSQQFGLYQTTRMWDCLLSYDGAKRYKYLYCLCLAILRIRKKQIMDCQFTDILPKLQRLKDIDLMQMIEIANNLYDKIVKVDIEKTLKKQQQQRQNLIKDKRDVKSQSLSKKVTTTINGVYDIVSSKTGQFFTNLTGFTSKFTKQ